MNINLKRILITMLLLFIALENFLQATDVGFSYSKDITHGTMTVAAQTHPGMILWAMIGFLLFLRIPEIGKGSGKPLSASLWRRFWAFLIDFCFGVAALSTIFALLPIFIESNRLGHFQWQFTRDYSVPSDWVVWPMMGFMMILLLLYFAYPLTRGSQTVGACLLRLTVVQDEKLVVLSWLAAIKRVLWAWLGMALFPYTIIKGRDAEGRTWYDRKSGFRTALLEKRSDPNSKKALHWVWYFVIFAVVCGAAYAYQRYFPQESDKPQWRTYSYNDYRFSLESPNYLPVDKPAYESKDLGQDELKKLSIDEDTPTGLRVEVDSSQHKEAVPADMINEFYKSYIKSATESPKVKNLKYDYKPIAFESFPGALITETYLWDDEPLASRTMVVVDRNWLWVLELTGDDNSTMGAMMDKTMQSFKIQK